MYKNKLISSNMAQPSLELCEVDPGDGFQYLQSYQNVSKWKNRNRWKNSQNYFFLTNFLMSYFKTLPEKRFFSKKRQFFHFFLLIHEIIFTHVHRLSICSLDTMATFRSNYRIFRAILRPIKIQRQNGHKKKRVFCQFCKFQSMLVLPGVD